MRVGDRVEVTWRFSQFFRTRGRIVSATPPFGVVLDDDPRPIFLGEESLMVVTDEPHIGGAE